MVAPRWEPPSEKAQRTLAKFTLRILKNFLSTADLIVFRYDKHLHGPRVRYARRRIVFLDVVHNYIIASTF